MLNERKQLLFLILFLFSFAAEAKEIFLSKAEKDCLTRSVYHEMRGKPKHIRLIVANIAINRKKMWGRKLNNAVQKFGAAKANICSIVQSKEYKSNIKLPIKEKEIFKKISYELASSNFTNLTQALFFSTSNGKVYIR